MPLPRRAPAAMTGSAVLTGTKGRVAIAHDWLAGVRGGERVLDAIIRLCEPNFRIVGLFTMFNNGAAHTPAIDRMKPFVSSIGGLSGANRFRRWLLPMYPAAVEDLSQKLEAEHRRAPIDLLISTSSAAIKGMRPPHGVPHICYCHSPARYLWSQGDQYTRGGGKAALRGVGLRIFGERLRKWDRATAANVTHFIANSTHVMREIARVYARPAEVVHPPVRTEFFLPPGADQSRAGWLYVGALEPYKRVDLAIRAAARSGEKLTVVGRGSELARLRSMAGPSVVFEENASDERLLWLYQRARLLLFPQIEDFGIVAAEAQACGTPVAAFGAGGAIDIVVENRTGVFFDDPTPESVEDAATRCVGLGDVADACRANAQRFSEERFESEMISQIARVLG